MSPIPWSNIRNRIPGGFIAAVGHDSSEAEKLASVEFSVQTKWGLGRDSLFGGAEPFLSLGSWDDAEESRLWVFVAVVEGHIVGYTLCQWHHSITDLAGNVLGSNGKPIVRAPSQPLSIAEILTMQPNDSEEWLEGWCLEGVLVESKFRRRGIGSLLLRTAADTLGTTMQEMAYGEPIRHDGAALLSSMGLSLDQIRRCMA